MQITSSFMYLKFKNKLFFSLIHAAMPISDDLFSFIYRISNSFSIFSSQNNYNV